MWLGARMRRQENESTPVVEQEPQHGTRVMRDASVPLTRIALRDANGDDRPTVERIREIRRLRGSDTPVPETGAGSDDAGPDPTHGDVEVLAGSPHERRGDVHSLHVSVETGPGRDRDLDEATLLQHP